MPNCRILLFAGILIAVGLQVTADPLAAQDRARFRRLVSVGVEPQIVKTLETAREHIREGQWEQAIPILQELIESGSDSLIPLEPGRFGNVAQHCHLLISLLSPAGLTEYRNRIDGHAAEWLALGQLRLDDVPLRKIVDRAFNSSYGDEALWLLGELAFERGRYAEARQWWQLLVAPRPPTDDPADADETPLYLTYMNPDVDAANVLARLVLCSVFEGDTRRAEVELSVFQTLHPQAEGSLAGQSGNLSELLTAQIELSRTWPPSRADTNRNPTFAGRTSRSPSPVEEPAINGPAWPSIPIPRARLKGPAGRADTLSLYPVVHDQTLFVANSGSVYAFDLKSGQPKWPLDGDTSGEIMTSLLHGPVMSDLPSSGVPRYTLSISEGRLYSRMGLPFTRRSVHEGSSFTELVGVDMERQGDVTFRVTPDILDSQAISPEATHWSFEGSPVVSGGRVYVTARRGTPEDETTVACFSADTSRLIWKRRVCVNVRNVPDHYNLVGHQLLTLGDGRLFLNTSTGAIAALDAATGRMLWVVTWPVDSDETYDEESNPQRHGLVPGLYHGGILYAVTQANELFAFDATTGQPTWQRQIRDRILHILGIADGRLIVSGNSLWALDVHTGDDAWLPQPRIGFEDPDGFGYGRGVVTARSVYWPLRDEILQVDHRAGEITRRIPLRQAYGLQGGNLLIAGNHLIIAQADRIDALTDVTPSPEDAPTEGTDSRSEPDDPDQPGNTPDSSEPPLDAADSTTALDVPSIWPVRRVWQQSIDQHTRVCAPQNVAAESASSGNRSTGILVQRNARTRLLAGTTGQDLWSVSSSNQPVWAASYRGRMLIASAHQLESRSLANGRLQWRTSPDSGRYRAFRLQSDGITAADDQVLTVTDNGVTAVDVTSGRHTWHWPPRDRRWMISNSAAFGQSESWVANRSSLLIRPANSTEYSLIKLPWKQGNGRGQRVRHGSLPFDSDTPVTFVPVAGGTGQALVGIADVNKVRLTRLAELGREWTRSASSQAHGPPRVLVAGGIIIVIEDAQFAVRREPATGNVLWKKSLGPVPLTGSHDETAIAPDALLAVSDGTLRCFSPRGGRLLWRRHLGQAAWAIQVVNQSVICRPSDAPTPGPANGPSNNGVRTVPITVCNLADGKLIQRVSIAPHGHVLNVYAGTDFCCVRTTDTLHGFAPYVSQTQSIPATTETSPAP